MSIQNDSACGSCCGGSAAAAPAEESRLHSAANLLLALSGVCAVAAEVLALAWQNDSAPLVVALAIIAILSGGRDTLAKGWRALRSFSLGIHFLMMLAVIGAAVLGHWPEAAMVLFLFEVAERIEDATLSHAKNSIRELMSLAPDVANVQGNSGEYSEVATAAVAVGQRVLVKPGERVPLDGDILSGASSLNQAPITGESLPVEKTVGEKVFAGSINGDGALTIRVSQSSENSTLARVARLVEQAQSQGAPAERFIERFAGVYTPIVVVSAVLVACVPPLLFGQSFADWMYRALVLLVISCPCALVISTPVALWSGLAAATRRGILVKGGAFLEAGAQLKMIAFDKTGTLTAGRPKVTDVVALNGVSRERVLHLAASINAASQHPIGSAIVDYWKTSAPEETLSAVENFISLNGRGASGTVADREYFVGNHRLNEERGVCNARVHEVLARFESDGKSAVLLSNDRETLGILGVADEARNTSATALRELEKLGVHSVMLTGDNRAAAERIATELKLQNVRADLLPEDKLRILDELRAEYSHVGMTGDGINDAPAMAKADVGIAMGAAGTDVALETADVALMDDDLNKLPQFIRIARATMTVLRQNIFFAIAIKAVFFGLALAGYATLWMAVFADVGASLLVVFNSLRLVKMR